MWQAFSRGTDRSHKETTGPLGRSLKGRYFLDYCSIFKFFVMMHIFGVWANLMSLGAIDFGIIVDGAVIIVESTVFILHQKMLNDKKIDQAEKDRIASSSAKKMMNSAFFGQLIILIVFLPILALEGVEGKSCPVNYRVQAKPGRGRRRGGHDVARLHANMHCSRAPARESSAFVPSGPAR